MTPALALPLQQHPVFASALQRLGRTVRFVDIDGAAPVLAVRIGGQLLTSRGPVWTDDRPCPSALRASGLRLLNADAPQDATLRAAGFRPVMTRTHIAELDLSGTPEQMRDRMRPKWRSTWRKAQTADLRLNWRPFDANTHDWLLKADAAQQKAKGFRALPHALVHAISQLDARDVTVLTAGPANAPIAAMLFLRHAPVVTYHIGWTSAQGRQHGAHHLMLAHAAPHFAKDGFTRMDLGGVDTQTAPGLARFKIGSGANVRALGGTWLRVPGL